MGGAMPGPRPTVRLDKWLWHARFFKTRALATADVAAGHMRVNGTRTVRPACAIGAGDTLTFAQGGQIRVIRVVATAQQRGPAAAARQLYSDLGTTAVAASSPLE